MKTYSEKLKDPRWQRKRLEVMQRDNFTCTQCGDSSSTLNVHHWAYSRDPWDVSCDDLSTVCEACHKEIEYTKKIVNSSLRSKELRVQMIEMASAIESSLPNHQEPNFDVLINAGPKNFDLANYEPLQHGEYIFDGFEFFSNQTGEWHLFKSAVGSKYDSRKCKWARKIRGFWPPVVSSVATSIPKVEWKPSNIPSLESLLDHD